MAKFDNDLAPFFDSLAVIRGQSVKACVFPGEYADPLASVVNDDSSALVTTILIRRIGDGAWNDPSNPPKVGDAIAIGEKSFAAMSVEVFDTNYFTIKAKSA